MEISMMASGPSDSVWVIVTVSKDPFDEKRNDSLMRLGRAATQAIKAGGKRGGGGDLERVAGQEGKHGESKRRLNRSVRQDG